MTIFQLSICSMTWEDQMQLSGREQKRVMRGIHFKDLMLFNVEQSWRIIINLDTSSTWIQRDNYFLHCHIVYPCLAVIGFLTHPLPIDTELILIVLCVRDTNRIMLCVHCLVDIILYISLVFKKLWTRIFYFLFFWNWLIVCCQMAQCQKWSKK